MGETNYIPGLHTALPFSLGLDDSDLMSRADGHILPCALSMVLPSLFLCPRQLDSWLVDNFTLDGSFVSSQPMVLDNLPLEVTIGLF